jgi:hypothetical protein
MPKSIATKQPNTVKRVKPPVKSQTPDQKNATDLIHNPKIQEVEQAASRVKRRAQAPADRSAELLLQEADVTNAGISSPQTAEKMTRIER